MALIAPEADEAQQIDEALAAWRQGDMARGPQPFVHLRVASGSLRPEGADSPNPSLRCRILHFAAPLIRGLCRWRIGQLRTVPSEVRGLIVVTQTCDIVRTCTDRPFVQLAPLVPVSNDVLGEIRKELRPNYAFVAGAASRNLVADLDRVMTVEKSVLANWDRVVGCSTDQEARTLARALARKRARFAFPDDFTQLCRPLQDRVRNKHGKHSDEGLALRALREIRVTAAPSWDAASIETFFWFVRDEANSDFEGRGWDELLDSWLARVLPTGRFTTVEGLVTTLADLTAQDYVNSDPLDLDHLSLPAAPPHA